MTSQRPAITVTNPGVTIWQDRGRHGFRQVGVPTSGPLHPTRYHHLRTLLPTMRAAWENLTGDITFTITSTTREPIHAAFTGPAVLHAATSSPHLHATHGTCTELPPGDYHLHRTGSGPVYFTIENWDTPAPTLGSVATDTHTHLGPEPLTAGYRTHLDTCTHHHHTGTFIPSKDATTPARSIGYLPHDTPAHTHLLTGQWRIHGYARNGIRLTPHGTTITPPHLPSIASIPVLPGVIQLPPDGNPIVLGPDSGTIGGYPTLGWLPEDHFEQLTTHTPGSAIRFHALTWDDSHSPATGPKPNGQIPRVRIVDITA